MKSHSKQYFEEVAKIANEIDTDTIDDMVGVMSELHFNGGRVFVLGVGGSAGNASHMVNDLRKLCQLEAYAPTDNVSELTARTNDEGFETVFEQYLKISKFNHNDILFVLSVGGGSLEKNVSINLVKAINYAKTQNAYVMGIVGKDNGYLAKMGDYVIIVPQVNEQRVTPHSEAFQAVVWHCMVSSPILQKQETKW